MKAMLQMKRIDIKGLEDAAKGEKESQNSKVKSKK
jgi:hypothetical protein